MSRIIGDEQVIKAAREASPGTPWNLVAFEPLDELSDDYEARISAVRFDINNDFDAIEKGNDPRMIPCTELFGVLRERAGIVHGTLHSEAIYRDVDINRLLCKPIEDHPEFRKTVVGHKATRTVRRMGEDGIMFEYPAVEVEFNAWDRALRLWVNEEEELEGYSKLIDGPYQIKEWGKMVEKTGLHFYRSNKSGQYACEPKYNTRWKRMKVFEDLKIWAQRNADTKSDNHAVRKALGMSNGFTRSQLLSFPGFVVAKISFSQKAVQRRIDSAAASPAAMLPGADLYGVPMQEAQEQEVREAPAEEPKPVPEQQTESFLTEISTEVTRVLGFYIIEELWPDQDAKDTMDKIKMEAETGNLDKNKETMERALNWIRWFESELHENQRMAHNLPKE